MDQYNLQNYVIIFGMHHHDLLAIIDVNVHTVQCTNSGAEKHSLCQ